MKVIRGLDAAVASGDTEVSKQQHFQCQQAKTGQASTGKSGFSLT